ncbi:TonB-dependent outer membrane receptor, SusC/RagA subfamily, signature region [bacterium A37T11]|nr:TonB-dependent outer membrane receptor, SusC/RagA subfamily, signature region [bacterium A37T11]
MPDAIIYLLKVNIAVLLFCAGYYGLLRRITFYQLNRWYLLFAVGFSLLYPFMDFSALWARQQIVHATAGVPISSLSFQVDHSFSAWPYVEILLGIALVVMASRLVVQLHSIRRIHRHSTPDEWQQYTYRNTRQAISPFSFWKQIYLHRAGHAEAELHEIFRHEFIHVQQLHSIDVLLAEFLLLVGWFNPAAWLLRQAIRENLEFITDRRVLNSGLDAKTYQYNLLRTLTAHQPLLANNFNFKNLKNRIIMMNKKQSSQFHLGKYLLLVPVILLFVSVFTISKAYQEHPKAAKDKQIAANVPLTQDSVPAKKSNAKHTFLIKEKNGKNPLIILNGEPSNQKTLDAIDPKKIESVNVLKDKNAAVIYGSRGSNGVILVTTKAEAKSDTGVITIIGRPPVSVKSDSDTSKIVRGYGRLTSDEPLYIIDGKVASKEAMNKMDPKTIESINVLKDQSAVATYGSLGNNGVIEIHTKTEKGPAKK